MDHIHCRRPLDPVLLPRGPTSTQPAAAEGIITFRIICASVAVIAVHVRDADLSARAVGIGATVLSADCYGTANAGTVEAFFAVAFAIIRGGL